MQPHTKMFTSFDGQPLAVTIWEPPQPATKQVVCINGIGGDRAAWEPLIELIATRHHSIRFITYDMRGYGQSSHYFPTGFHTLCQVMTQDLAELIAAYDTTLPTVWVGHSFGGIVLQNYFTKHPLTKTNRAVLICTHIKTPVPFNPARWWYRLLIKLPPPRATLLRTKADHLKAKNSWDYSPFRLYQDIQVTGGLIRFLIQYAAIFGWQNHSPETLNNPQIFYIYGLKDQVIFPWQQRQTIRSLPQMKSFALHTSHNAIVNDAETLAQIFIDEVLAS